MGKDYKLYASGPLSSLARRKGFYTWKELLEHIKNLPYGRNSNRKDLALVLQQNIGTCSSKHALLMAIANENKLPNIELVLGIYRMNELNTPKIGNELTKYSLDYIPEAHCYLKIDGKRKDLTFSQSAFNKIEENIIKEIIIEPYQVAEFKVDFHQTFIKNWLENEDLKFNFEQIWQIREQCIKNIIGDN